MSLAPILQHHSSPARISVQQGPAQLRASQPQGRLSISTTPAALDIRHVDPQLSINSSAARASMKYFSMQGLLGEISRISKQKGAQGVGTIVSDGLAYQGVENGGGAVQSIARSKMFDNKQFGVVLMPSVPPSISYTPGQVSINASASAAQVQFQRQAPMISVEPQRTSVSFSAPQLSFSLPGSAGLDLRA